MNNQRLEVKPIPVKRFIPGITWFFVVLVLMCLPGSDIPTVDDWLNHIYFDKWVHFGLFAILVFSFIYPVTKLPLSQKVKRQNALKIAIAACIWGFVIELIQKFFIAERSFDMVDWAADSFGVLFAYIFCRRKFLNFK